MLKVNNLNKYFNRGKTHEIHVINNTTLEFSKTGLVCILGESGSGKTTLLNTLGGLDTFQSGSIEIDQTTLSRYSEKEIEKLRDQKFSYIFQDQFLLQEHSVAYNIGLALNNYALSEEEREARIDYVLQAVDMKKYKKRLISQLSGGQKQRIAIARALVKSPEVIFADEPTGNLDEANTMRVMSTIKKISKDCLVILVTHEKRLADFFADRILEIKDGRVTRDMVQEGAQALHYKDDIHLYLQDYHKETLDHNNISFNVYNSKGKDKLMLDIVSLNDKYYIQSTDETKVVFLTSKDEMQLIDAHQPEILLEQIEDFDYSLPKISKERKPSLPWKEAYALAKANMTALGKRHILMMVSFIITAVLLVIGTADYLTTASIDKKDIITEDSNYLSVASVRKSTVAEYDYLAAYSQMYETFLASPVEKSIYIDLNAKVSFAGKGFDQLSAIQYTISDCSYVTLEHFREEDLILGRMPVSKDEVIMDRWLFDIFRESDSVLKTSMTKLDDFLGLELSSSVPGQKLVVAGICDSGEPTIYLDKYKGISIAGVMDGVAPLSQLKAAYPKKYNDLQLATDEVLVSEEYYGARAYRTGDTIAMNGEVYQVAGTFPRSFLAKYVVYDDYYPELLSWVIARQKRFMLYGSDKEAVYQYFTENKKSYETEVARWEVKDIYQDQLQEYEAKRKMKMNALLVLTATIFTASTLMLYFTMKSNVMKRVQDISVYRLMGISKTSILFAFMLEIIMITNATVLPVVLALSGLIRFLSGLPSLRLEIVYPWWVMLCLLVFIYAINIIVGVLPVHSIVKLPPARIGERS